MNNNYIHIKVAGKQPKRSNLTALLFVIATIILSPFSYNQGLVSANDDVRGNVLQAITMLIPVTPPITPPDPTPTPTPTPTPPVTPPDPTPTPTPVTPPDPQNSIPFISTIRLKSGTVGISYKSTVSAFDTDINDTLIMAFSIPPQGLSLGTCNQKIILGFKTIKCSIQGIPEVSGNYQIQVTVQDNNGGTSSKTLPLKIKQSI